MNARIVAVLRIGADEMIRLTRLNRHPLAVNSDLIKFIEQAPDTVITLVNGEKLIVRESADEVLDRIVDFRRSVLQGLVPGWDRIANLSLPERPEKRADDQAER